MRSGVVAPLLLWGALPFAGAGGVSWLVPVLTSVVARVRLVVSELGGGGRVARMDVVDSVDARQRKHSPVP